jgi:hypothetical protein
MEFVDYPQDKIQAKLKQVQDFEKLYGECDASRGWIKWCTDINYRKREWQWRQNLAKWNSKHNTNNYR